MIRAEKCRFTPGMKRSVGIFFGLLLFYGAPAQAQVAIQFTDVTAAAGIKKGEQYSAVNFHSLGIDWIDFNNDGRPDLFAVNGFNRTAHLYKNQGNGTFLQRDDLLPTLRKDLDMGGAVFADYDNDGDDDIFIFTDYKGFSLVGPNEFSGPPDFLLQNQGPPDYNFVDVAATAGVDDLSSPSPAFGLEAGHRSMTGGWLDYDRDGCLDLYVGHWVLQSDTVDGPDAGPGSIANKDRLYRNNCQGAPNTTFTDVTDLTGIYPNPAPSDVVPLMSGAAPTGLSCTGINCYYRPTLAFIGAHLNSPVDGGPAGDLDPDMYVVNVHDYDPLSFDFIFKNNGNSTFTDVTSAGDNPAAVPPAIIGDDAGAGMGIDVADIDLDGDWDVYMSDILASQDEKAPGSAPYGNVLYINQFTQTGQLKFEDNSIVESGVAGDFSWGVSFLDADQDGDEDLFVATISDKPKFLYRNDGDSGTGHVAFTNVIVGTDLDDPTMNLRGSATADYDGDGDLDLIVVNQNGPLQLFRNETTAAGNWIQIRLVPDPAYSNGGKKTNRNAINALVKVFRDGIPTLMRQVKGGSSAHSQDSLLQHFGLGSATAVTKIEVSWPSGAVDLICNRAANRLYEIKENTAQGVTCPSGDVSQPDAAGVVIASTGQEISRIDLSWTAATDATGVVAYEVYRNDQWIANRAGTDFTDRALIPSTPYCYKVKAVDAAGNVSSFSPPTAPCPTTLPDITPPATPTNLTAVVVGTRDLELNWEPAVDNSGSPVHYRILRGDQMIMEQDLLAYTDTDLVPDTNYCYTVIAVDGAGLTSSPSNPACAMPVDAQKPEPPTGLTAVVVGSTSVALSWTAAVDDVGVVKYRVYRGAENIGEPTETTFTDTTVSPGTAYTYTVSALDNAGNESFTSAPVEVTTPAASSGGGGGGGSCFIATAAYGSPMAPQVVVLREFRDRYLVSSVLGRRFIEFYYTYSPSLAETIRGHKELQAGVRLLLWPVVGLAWFIVKTSFVAKWGVMFGLMFVIARVTYSWRGSR
ncbi:MAG: CFI-box-CTERM domain-containing protein [Nitrospirota bacterium]